MTRDDFNKFIESINAGDSKPKSVSTTALDNYFKKASSLFKSAKDYSNPEDYYNQTIGLNKDRFNAFVELVNNRDKIGEDNYKKINEQLSSYSNVSDGIINSYANQQTVQRPNSDLHRTNADRMTYLQSLLDKGKSTSKTKQGFFQSFISDYEPIKNENVIEKGSLLTNGESIMLNKANRKNNATANDYRVVTESILKNQSGRSADAIVNSAIENGWYDALKLSVDDSVGHSNAKSIDQNWKKQLQESVAKNEFFNAVASKNGGKLPDEIKNNIDYYKSKSADELNFIFKQMYPTENLGSTLDLATLAELERRRKNQEYNLSNSDKAMAATLSAVPAGMISGGKGIINSAEAIHTKLSTGTPVLPQPAEKMTDEQKAEYNKKRLALESEALRNGNSGINESKNTIYQKMLSSSIDSSLSEAEILKRQADNARKYPALAGYQNVAAPNVQNNTVGRIASGLAFSTANMLPSIAANMVLPGSGTVAIGLSSGGNAYEEALLEGKTQKQALGYGILSGVSEAITEKLLGGIKAVGGGTTSKVLSKVSSNASNKIMNAVKKVSNSRFGSYLLDGLSEANEEWLQANLEPIFRNAIFDENNEIKPFSQDKLEAALLGFLSASVLNAPNLISGGNTADYTSYNNDIVGASRNQEDIAKSSVSLKPYTESDIKYFKQNQNNLIDGVDANFDEYAKSFYNSETKKGVKLDGSQKAETIYLGRLNDSVSGDVNAIISDTKWGGIDTSDFNVQVKNSDIVHFYDQHGSDSQNGQIPLTPDIVAKLTDTISDPDIISLSDNSTKQDKPVLYFVKKINGYSVVLEAVSPSKKALLPKTMYAFKSDSQEFSDFVSKLKKSRFRHPIGTESRTGLYAQGDRTEALSNPTIPQEQSGVKNSIRENAENMTENRQIRVPESELKIMKAIAKNHKIPFEIKDLGVDAKGSPIEGKYENGVIYVSPYAKNPSLVIFKHELTHYLEKDTYRYGQLLNVVKNYYDEMGETIGTDYAAEIRKIYDNYRTRGKTLEDGEAERELVANFAGKYLFTDEKAIQYLAGKKPSIARSILNWIREQIAAIKGDVKSELLIKAERMYVNALKAADKRAGIEGKAKYSTQYSLGYTTDNKPVVVVEDDILKGVPKNKWIETVKNTISEKFSDGIPVSGRLIKVNSVTRNEYANSRNTRYLRATDGSVYADKFKSANNLDEIVLASTNYINEDLKHQRNDSFKEFARGDVLIRVGDNDYSAKVIVGFTGGKEMVLYDIINFTPTEFSIKKERTHQGYAQAGSPRKDVSSGNTTVPQKAQSVNTSISKNAENDTKNSQFYLDESNSVPLEQRVSGDDLLDAQDLIDTVKDVGAKVDENGYITVYHRTNNQSKEKILSSGRMTAKEDGIFFSTKKDGQNSGYGSEIIEFKIPAEKLMLDDIFDDEAHLRLPLKKAGEIIDVSQYLNKDTGKAQYSLSDSDQNQQSDLNLLFDDDFYEQFKYEDKTKISKSIEELEKIKASDDFDNMSFEDAYKVNTDLKALKAGYDNQYDYIVGREKQRLAKEYERGSSTVMSMIDKKKKQIAKQEQLSRDISESTPFKNAQFEIIQKSNPMWDDYHTGIRSPKDIKTFSEVIDDGESFAWGDFSKEDAERAIKRGTVRVYSSYPIKNGVFVSTSYQQALDYAGGEPSGVHSRVVALDSVAWINGDEGQYAKVYNLNAKNDTGKAQFSLSDDYDNAVEQYGAIPPGENPARDVKVPKQMNDNTKVRRTVRTAMEASGTPGELVDRLKVDIANDVYDYKVVSDKSAVSSAKDRLDKWGLEKCYQYWKSLVNEDRKISKNDMALAEQMYIEAAHNGDFKVSQELMVDIAEEATRAGQNAQSIRLLKNLTPEGRIYKIDKLVYRIQKEIDRKTNGKAKTIKVDENLKKRMLNAKSQEEMDAIEHMVHKNIAKQMPEPTKLEKAVRKWNEWRYLAMLGNPRTHIRNIFGNALFAPMVNGKNAIGIALERTLSKDNRTKARLTAKDKATIEFAKSDFDTVNAEESKSSKNKYNESLNGLDVEEKVFKNKALEWARKTNSNLLEWEDTKAKRKRYSKSFAQFIKARGWDYQNLTDSQLDSARNYAMREAKRATFQDTSEVANALNKLSHQNIATEVLVEGLLPFKKTPINILKRGVEYSPFGIAKGIKELAWDVKKGNMNASQAIDTLSCGLSGTAMMMVGVLLSSLGVLTSTSDDDKEGEFDKLSGNQEYALQFFGKSYTIDWIAPLSIPLFIGAEIENAVERGDADNGAGIGRVLDALTGISDPMFNLSMLQGINSSIKTVRYSDNPTIDLAANTVSGYLGQGIPTILGQTARTVDTTRRNSYYTPKDSAAGKLIDKTIKKTAAKIPGVSMLLEPYIDKWGNEQVADNWVLNAFENFASPGYYSENTNDSVTEEMARLYKATSDTGVVPHSAKSSLSTGGNTYRLSEKEYTQYQKTLGKASHEQLQKLINSTAYSNMSNEEKAVAVGKMYRYAEESAKVEFYKGRGIDFDDTPTIKKFNEVEESGVDLYEYLYAYVSVKDMESDKNASGETIRGSLKRKQISCMVNQLGIPAKTANKIYDLMH